MGHTAAATADDKDESRQHFENGIALISAEPKDYPAALVEFRASVRLFPTKSGLYNLALCYRRLSRYAEALDSFARLQAEFGDSMSAGLRRDVEWEVQAIRRLTVQLTIVVDQPGATIRLDGDMLGKSPLGKPLVLGPREYRLEVERAGFEPAHRKLTLAAGQKHVEKIRLEPLSAKLMITTYDVLGASILVDGQQVGLTPLGAPLSIPPGQHVIQVSKEGYDPTTPQRIFLQGGGAATLSFQLFETVLRPEPKPAPKPDAGEIMRPALPWLGAGLTAAAGIGTMVLWYHAEQRHKDFESANAPIAEGVVWQGDQGAAFLDQQRQQAADDADKLGAAAIGTGIAAGVLAVTTAVLFAVDLNGDNEGDRGVTARPGGLAVRF